MMEFIQSKLIIIYLIFPDISALNNSLIVLFNNYTSFVSYIFKFNIM